MFKIHDGRSCFYQWDINRKLIVNDATIKQVHFCNRTEDCALVCETYLEDGATVVNVPNILLQSDWKIRVYAYDGMHTKHDACYEVKARSKPADYAYTETEILNWNVINEKVNTTLTEVEAAEIERQANEQARQQAEENRYNDFNFITDELNTNISVSNELISDVENTKAEFDEALNNVGELSNQLSALITYGGGEVNSIIDSGYAVIEEATQAIANTNKATEEANKASNSANLNSTIASMAAQTAREAATTAINAASATLQATEEATTATTGAIEATQAANEAATNANNAAYGINNKFANALKGTASGEVVAITDISPVEHNLGVNVSSINLLDADKFVNSEFVKNEDGSYTFTKNNNSSKRYTKFIQFNEPIPIGTQLSISVNRYESENVKEVGVQLQYTDDTYYSSYAIKPSAMYVSFKATKAIKGIRLYLSQTESVALLGAPVILGGIQLTIGNTVKPYTPYVDVSTVNVNAYGKNLIPYPYQLGTRTLNGITFTDNGDGTITANGTATATTYYTIWEHTKEKIKIIEGETYTLTGCPSGGGTSTYQLVCQCVENNSWLNLWEKGTGATTTAKGNAFVKVIIYIANGVALNNVVFKPMLEIGTEATPYEPYIEPTSYPVAPDGTVEVTSIYPNTTLLTNTTGVLIEAEYNRDINKAFAELQEAIISLGGNI